MHHTQAIILRKNDWNEADWLVTALTENFGKIRLLAQGARKHGAKLRGHLEPGSLAEVSFVVGRNGYRLTTAQLVNFFPAIRGSYARAQAAEFLLRLLDTSLFEDRDRAKEIFELASAVWEMLARADPRANRRIAGWFTVQFLRILGVLPPLDSEEARYASRILALGSRRLAEVENLEIPGGVLEEELGWLGRRIGFASSLTLPTAERDSAI